MLGGFWIQHVCVCINIDRETEGVTYIHTYIHTLIHTYLLTYTYTYIHTYITYNHTHIHMIAACTVVSPVDIHEQFHMAATLREGGRKFSTPGWSF